MARVRYTVGAEIWVGEETDEGFVVHDILSRGMSEVGATGQPPRLVVPLQALAQRATVPATGQNGTTTS